MLANERLDKIDKAGWGRVKFFLMGGLKSGDPLYYRVRSEGIFVIEYINKAFSPANIAADHQHTVWRDFQGDWGRDVLGEDQAGYGPDILKHHYETSSHHAMDRAHHVAHREPHHHVAHRIVRASAVTRCDIGRLENRTVWMTPPPSSAPYLFGG
jgi:hypothetical protein